MIIFLLNLEYNHLNFFKIQQIHCPIRIIHAFKDEEVDLEKSQTFLENVATLNVDLFVRKQGNHRLMKPRDLTLVTYVIDKLLKDIEKVKSKV